MKHARLILLSLLFVLQINAQEARPVSWPKLVPNILSDQKQVFLKFPEHVIHKHNWVPVAAILAVTGGLIATDQYVAPHLRRTTYFDGYNSALTSNNTTIGIVVAPVALYGAGLLTKNKFAQNTALLTGEAIADSEIVATLLKVATRRQRPSDITPYGNFADSWADSKKTFSGSFPSGHTIAAFSVATIFSRRYGARHKWMPYVAYGLAGAVGFSRLTLSAHFPSDVFMGAALGYAISRFAVLHSNATP